MYSNVESLIYLYTIQQMVNENTQTYQVEVVILFLELIYGEMCSSWRGELRNRSWELKCQSDVRYKQFMFQMISSLQGLSYLIQKNMSVLIHVLGLNKPLEQHTSCDIGEACIFANTFVSSNLVTHQTA